MGFDAIVVPRGAEARAVERGWPKRRPPLFAVRAGARSACMLGDGRSIETALVLGLCGALDPALRVGDTVVYEGISNGAETIELDAHLVAASARLLHCPTVRAANVAAVVGDPGAKAALRARSGAAAIDMEGAAIATAFHARGVRVAMIRVVSDEASSHLPDLDDVYDGNGALRPLALAWAFARRPVRSAGFIRDVLRALGALRITAQRLSQ